MAIEGFLTHSPAIFLTTNCRFLIFLQSLFQESWSFAILNLIFNGFLTTNRGVVKNTFSTASWQRILNLLKIFYNSFLANDLVFFKTFFNGILIKDQGFLKIIFQWLIKITVFLKIFSTGFLTKTPSFCIF